MSTLESACAPPLRMFIIGTGSRCALGPPRYRKRLSSAEPAAALATASETPRMALAPSADLSGVASRSSIFWSIRRCSLASYPTSSGAIRSAMLSTARWTPLPPYRLGSPSRSSIASNAPVDAPDGTAARAIVPSSSPISTSMVGFPRESRISLATIASMVATSASRSATVPVRHCPGLPLFDREPSERAGGPARQVTELQRGWRDLQAHARLEGMGPAPSVPRARRAAVATVLALVMTGVLALVMTGCSAQVIDRAALVNDLASRLDHASQLTYTADYQLRGGRSATIAQAQRPFRAAYSYPGGKVVITPDGTTDCRTEAGTLTCTLRRLTALDGAGNQGADRSGIVPPALVVGLLTAAALDSNAVISQHDTTIAGEHATCVDVSGVDNAPASAFTACITAGGILGSFQGVVDGVEVEISMTGLRDTVAENAFDPPAGAKIVDQRAGG